METITCLFCQEANYRVLYQNMPDLLTGLPGKFQLVICNNCQLVYQNPRPDPSEIATYYPDDYESYIRATPLSLSPLQKWLIDYGLRKRARPILEHYSTGRVLDIGCATGYYLNYLRKNSQLELFGVEPNANSAQFAREQFNLNVHPGDLKSAHFPDNYFNAITMWDVLEHLPNPLESLVEIRRILRPDGFLLFKVPLIDGLDAHLFGPYWAGLDAPRHFYVYSRETLFRLLEETGFRPLRMWNIGGSYFSFSLSLQFWLNARFPSNKSIRAILQLFRRLPLRLITSPYFYVMDQLKLSSQITVLAVINNDRDQTP